MRDAPDVLTLGHSPDPDDAFMFWALAKGRIDTGGLRFEHVLEDIETLNRRALRGELHVTALSLHAYAHVLDRYALLPCGASVGDGYGPMVVARGDFEPANLSPADLRRMTIAIPGTLTTAYLALRLALGDVRTETIAFDAIPRAVQEGKYDAGLLIHEGQLTYASLGLRNVLDLGAWWRETTGLPLPLGVNGIRKDLGPDLMRRVSGILRASIEHGLAHRAPAVAHALAWARDMDASLADRFVGMYVNDFTLDLGDRGRKGVELLLARAFEAGITPRPVTLEFVD